MRRTILTALAVTVILPAIARAQERTAAQQKTAQLFERNDRKGTWGFRKAIKTIKKISYNPRPIPTNTADVTGISETQSRTDFLNAFNRVTITAPANGKTFKASDSNNRDDITLVGFERSQTGPGGSNRPWIIQTHGGSGTGSIATQGQFLIHMANVLFSNGYNVLNLDRRDGLLTHCAYKNIDSDLDGQLDPDPTSSVPPRIGSSPTRFCNRLPNDFRDPSYTPNSLPSGRGPWRAGDILAAAQYLKDTKGAGKIGVLSGSNGGLLAILAASNQDRTDNDFDAGLLDALLVFSPVGDFDTNLFSSSQTEFGCFSANEARFYSKNVNGSLNTDFDSDPEGTVKEYFDLLNGVSAIEDVKIPVLILYALTDNQISADQILAYKAKTDKMKLAHTMIMTRLGHFHEMWQSDPFWADKVVLTYLKKLLARKDPKIGDSPGFLSLGPNAHNPLLVSLRVKKKDGGKFLSKDSIAPFLLDACFTLGYPSSRQQPSERTTQQQSDPATI